MAGIGIITNPHSKMNKRDPSRPHLLAYILGQRGKVEITENFLHLKEALTTFRNNEIEILAINGGDGTISQTISHLIEIYQGTRLPLIYLLRGGTMNVIASSLGVYGRPETLLFELTEIHGGGANYRTRTLQTMSIDNYHGFLYADGSFVRMLKKYYERKSGYLRAFALGVWYSLLSFFDSQSFREVFHATSTTMDGMEPVDAIGSFATTIDRIPLGIKPFPKSPAGTISYLLPVCAARKLLFHIPGILLNRKPGRFRAKISGSAETLVFKDLPDHHEYTVDGELFVHSRPTLRIGLGPQIEFIIP